jgi:predicted phosphodiesterase
MKTGFIADVHGHVEALEIALRLLAARGAERVCFLGDAVGYLPGIAALPLIEAACDISLKGNHEVMLLNSQPPAEGKDEVYRIGETKAMCADLDILARIENWPVRFRESGPGGTCLLVHGSPTEPLDGYLYPDTELGDLEADGAAYVFCAQTHRPFVRRTERTIWINCGSVGLPRDDGRFGSLALFDSKSGRIEILRFDIKDATLHALARVGTVSSAVHALYRRRAEGQLQGDIVA